MALAVAWGLLGPPKLPPLPGERPPEPAPTEDVTAVTPTRPTPKPASPSKPSGPAPQRPAARPDPPPTTPEPSPSTVPGGSQPQPLPGVPTVPGPRVAEPPQPEARGPAPETTEDAPPARRREGPGSAPAMGDELLPGEEQERPVLRFPPPVRPPYSGTGLMIGAGISFGASLAEQIVAHVLVKRRCIDPLGRPMEPDPMSPDEVQDEAQDFGQTLLRCAPGVLPAVALRIYSDVGLLTTIGLAAGGAAMAARQRAYDDVFADRAAPPMLGLRIAGASLVGVGVITWLTTGAVSWGLLASCRDAACASRARLMAFTTRDAGAVLTAAGAGMLSYTLAHRRAYDRTLRERLLSVGTTFVPGGGAGLSVSGRF